MFTAELRNAADGYVVNTPLQLVPTRWSDHEIGGPDVATVTVAGPLERLFEPLDWLGHRVVIYNEAGSPVWWGYVHEAEINTGALTLNRTLDDMANRIAVAYTVTAATGAESRETTDWAEHAGSITRYGTKELLKSASNVTANLATQRRDLLLELMALPRPQRRVSDDEPGATLHCRGYWSKLDWFNYVQLAGKEEYTGGADVYLPLNAAYTATTISFTAADNLFDSAVGLGWLATGDQITIAGTSSNNGTWFVEDLTAAHANLEPNTIVNEGAGGSFTIYRGGQVRQKIGQSFSLGYNANWSAIQVAVLLRKVGTPTDNITLEFRSDSAGTPVWPPIATVNVAAATLTQDLAWVAFEFSTAQALTYGTTYWIVLARSGSADPSNYVELGASTQADYTRGSAKATDGSSWYAVTPTVDIPFRVIGELATTAQLENMIEAGGYFTGADVLDASGRNSPQYRGGDTSAANEVLKLLEAGTSAGDRLLARVQGNRQVQIYAAPASTTVMYVYGADGIVRSKWGNKALDPGALLAGQWIEVELPAWAQGQLKDVSPVFVARSEYDAANERLTWDSAGTQSVWEEL